MTPQWLFVEQIRHCKFPGCLRITTAPYWLMGGSRTPHAGAPANQAIVSPVGMGPAVGLCSSGETACRLTRDGAPVKRILLQRRKFRLERGKCAKTPIIPGNPKEKVLASQQEMAAFLAEVERRAYKHAKFAVRDDDAALDIVQDSMMKIVEKYSDKPATELPMLFHRILQNTIHDYFRRTKVRSTWTTLLSSLSGKNREGEDDDHDPLDTMAVDSASSATVDPELQLNQAQTLKAIEQALERLPARQREAFLLRYWEELDVAETAAAMGCSEGSVKTHCSRAVHALAETLKAKGITL